MDKVVNAEHHLIEASIEGIKSFKKSKAYHEELLASCSEAFLIGFIHCKRKLGELHPKIDLHLVLVLASSSSSSSSADVGGDGNIDGDAGSHP